MNKEEKQLSALDEYVNIDELINETDADSDGEAVYTQFARNLEAEILRMQGRENEIEKLPPVTEGAEKKISERDDGKIFRDAVKLAVERGEITSSYLQRKLIIGYGKAAWVMETMESLGYISPWVEGKPRKTLITAEEYERKVADGTLLGGE